ncbi:MAG TPA: HGGxSTG domain-containing protein [Acetobacteraceae bacterium]|nr:HGGxSTG domain-containing protein [Acetobacteraceae bacterium]
MGARPHEQREPAPALGRLRNGNPSGNPHAALRCGARNRAGEPCRAPAMSNGRCRCHGGKSTGPRTQAGLQRLRAAHTVHGFYGADGRAFRHTIAALFAQGRWLRRLAELTPVPSGQNTGVRPDTADDAPRSPR